MDDPEHKCSQFQHNSKAGDGERDVGTHMSCRGSSFCDDGEEESEYADGIRNHVINRREESEVGVICIECTEDGENERDNDRDEVGCKGREELSKENQTEHEGALHESGEDDD